MALISSLVFSFIGLTSLVVTPFSFAAASLEPVTVGYSSFSGAALDILSYQYPQAKDTDPNLIIDASIIKTIEQSGFIKTLYEK